MKLFEQKHHFSTLRLMYWKCHLIADRCMFVHYSWGGVSLKPIRFPIILSHNFAASRLCKILWKASYTILKGTNERFLTDGTNTSDHCVPYLDISFRGCSVPTQYVLYGVSLGIIWVSNIITNMLLQWRNHRFPYVSISPAYWWIPLTKPGNARLWRFFYLILNVLLKKQSVWISRWLVVYQGNEDESAEIVFHCKCLLNDSYAQNQYY